MYVFDIVVWVDKCKMQFYITRIFCRYTPKNHSPCGWLGSHPCCTWPNSSRACTKERAKDQWWAFSPWLYRVPSWATFIFFTTSKFCTLKEQWWAFGPPLWASSPLLMTFEDVAKLFYFMTFISKFHILSTRGKKSGFFLPILYTFWPFWRTEKEKNIKWKSCILFILFLSVASVFFIFSQEMPQY